LWDPLLLLFLCCPCFAICATESEGTVLFPFFSLLSGVTAIYDGNDYRVLPCSLPFPFCRSLLLVSQQHRLSNLYSVPFSFFFFLNQRDACSGRVSATLPSSSCLFLSSSFPSLPLGSRRDEAEGVARRRRAPFFFFSSFRRVHGRSR